MWSFKPIFEDGLHIPDIGAAQFHCLAKTSVASPPPATHVRDGVLHPTIQFSDMIFFKFPHIHVKAQWVDRPGKEATVWDAVYVTPPKADMKALLSGKLQWSSLDWKANIVKNNLPGPSWVHMRTLCVPPDNQSHRLMITVKPADSEMNDVNRLPGGVAVLSVEVSGVETVADRVEAFLAGRLQPYVVEPETRAAQVLRIGRAGLEVAKSSLAVLPVGGQIGRLVTAVYLVTKLGPLYVHTSELVRAVAILLRLMRSAELRYGSWWRVAASDIGLRIYYRMAEGRGVRGRDPDLEHNEHMAVRTGGFTLPELRIVEKYCALATIVAYEKSAADAQRLLAMQGYQLIATTRNSYVAGSVGEREIVVVIAGTSSITDVSVDVDAFETDLREDSREEVVLGGGGGGRGHGGIVRAAKLLLEEIGPSLALLSRQGFKVRVAGHSLGAGIGAVLTALLRSEVKDIHCFGFGSPPCVDASLASWLDPVVTNVVLRDDLVCRATVKNVESLVDSLLEADYMQTYIAKDWETLKDFRSLFALKQRAPLPTDQPPCPSPKIMGRGWNNPFKLIVGLWRSKRAVIEDTRPGLVLAGRIFHIYSRNGLWFGGFVNKGALTLNRIEVQTEMLADHAGDAYLRAVAQLGRGGRHAGVPWQAFSAAAACSCCLSDFSWNSTLKGEPHCWLARCVCRRCGSVVCVGCSQRRRAVPEFGIFWPVRHCDRCWLRPAAATAKL